VSIAFFVKSSATERNRAKPTCTFLQFPKRRKAWLNDERHVSPWRLP